MKITPLEIYNKRFKKGFSLWSYHKDEVDDFVEQIGSEFEVLYKEVSKLRDDNIKLTTLIQKQKEDEIKLRQSLLVAQETHKESKDEALKEGSIIIEEAKLKSQKLLDEVKSKIQEKYSQYNRLVELEELFKVRFQTLLESHLRYLEKMGEADLSVSFSELNER